MSNKHLRFNKFQTEALIVPTAPFPTAFSVSANSVGLISKFT